MYIITRPLRVVHSDLSLNVTDTIHLFKRLKRFIFSRKLNNATQLFNTNEIPTQFFFSKFNLENEY